MKISRSKEVGGSQPTAAPSPSSGVQKRPAQIQTSEQAEPFVGVSLSDASQTVAAAKERLATVGDVRIERVSEIRLAVDEGSYKVEAEVVAKRMVDESLRESAHRKRGRKR